MLIFQSGYYGIVSKLRLQLPGKESDGKYETPGKGSVLNISFGKRTFQISKQDRVDERKMSILMT